MRLRTLILALAACGGPAAVAPPKAPTAPPPTPSSAPASAPALAYPPARRGDVVDDYHGVQVADPYRWLEDLDSVETRAWVEAESKLAADYLAKLPMQPRFKERLTALWNYEKYGVPWNQRGRYFYSYNSGLQPQAVLYTTRKLGGDARVLVDPNTLAADGTVALAGWSLSDDARLLAYGLATAGSDWTEWHVKNVDTGADLPDVVHWSKFGPAVFTKDGKGFFYTSFDAPPTGQALKNVNRFPKIRYHRLGTGEDKDAVVYTRPDQPDWDFSADVSEDGRWLWLTVSTSQNDKNAIYVEDLGKKNGPVVAVAGTFADRIAIIGNVGTRGFALTDRGAPKKKLMAFDIAHPDKPWTDVLPEDAAATLEQVTLVGGRLVAAYLEDAHSRVAVYDLQGRHLRDIALPGIGSAGGFGGRHDAKETFYAYTTFTAPPSIFRYDLATGASSLFRAPKLAFDPDAFETEQLFATSKDGTRVPIFLSHKKGLVRDGQSPTILYGYGGFDIPTTPRFNVWQLAWLEAGGVVGNVVLRGGGEYGEAWHEAAMKEHKQNVFDDFIAAGEYLIHERVTQPAKLGMNGGSNGGLLVGAVLTQRPELFGAAVPQVGVMDMLRFQKFTIGWVWASEYGSSDDPEQMKALLAYSPLHHLKPGTHYPPTLITTADHDDRVFPAHSFKFAAALQAAQGGPAPVLIRIDLNAGHGAGKPTAKYIDEAADRLAFFADALGMK
jgi:prolyl oligopeptidase